MASKRALVTVLLTDAVGFSTRARENEALALEELGQDFAVIRAEVEAHQGRVLKSTGDGLLIVFDSAGLAVECAVKVQRAFADRGDDALKHRMGIHLCDALVDEDDARGDGVNIASRLQELAHPGTVCISRTTYDVIQSRLGTDVRDLGRKQLKNIPDPIGVVEIAPYSGFKLPRRKKAINLAWVGVAAVAASVCGLYFFIKSTNDRFQYMLANQKPSERVIVQEKPIYITQKVLGTPSTPVGAGAVRPLDRRVGAPAGLTKPVPTVPIPQKTESIKNSIPTPAPPPSRDVKAEGTNSPFQDGSTPTPAGTAGDTQLYKGLSLTKLFGGDPKLISNFTDLYSRARQTRNYQSVLDFVGQNGVDNRTINLITRHVTALTEFEDSTLAAMATVTKDQAIALPNTKSSIYGGSRDSIVLVGENGRERTVVRSQIRPNTYLQLGRYLQKSGKMPLGYLRLLSAYQLEYGGLKKGLNANKEAKLAAKTDPGAESIPDPNDKG